MEKVSIASQFYNGYYIQLSGSELYPLDFFSKYVKLTTTMGTGEKKLYYHMLLEEEIPK